jgi:pimeloyl-ACP methyl ester carboxylesterase
MKSLAAVATAGFIALAGEGIPASLAQQSSPDQSGSLTTMREFDSGDLDFRTHTYLRFSSVRSPQVLLVPGQGFGGQVFLERVDGSPGWSEMLPERGFNAYALDNVGCGKSLPPPSDDFVELTRWAAYGVYQMSVATRSSLIIAQGHSAGFAVIARSLDPVATHAAILIDPIGPQQAQPMTEITPQELLERHENLEAWLWQTWGFGSERGTLRRGLDLAPADADSLIHLYDRQQPPYWVAMLTHMDTATRVQNPSPLMDWPVLLVRTPGRSTEQIEREDALAAWLTEHGARVNRLDLQEEGFADVSGLPWAGRRAGEVLDRLLQWYDSVPPGDDPVARERKAEQG